MSAQKLKARGVLGAFLGFLGMSVVAGLLVSAAVTPAIAVTGVAANDGIGVFEGLPEYLQIDQLSENSTIYANQGGQPVPIATFYDQNRVEVPWDKIGQDVKDAAVSTEDPRFYEHGGIDLTGTIRGALMTLLHKQVQGGSSITQQYVKNVLVMRCEKYNITVEAPTPDEQKRKQAAQDKLYQGCYHDATETTPDRKLKEMKMAIGLEKKYSKNQILTGYLNIAGFGGQIYGIESAARYYYGASAATLTLPQAASLIAIINNPNNLRIDETKADNPDNNAENGFKLTLVRRDYVLKRMHDAKKITTAQYDEALKTKIEPHITPQPNGCQAAAKFNQSAPFYCNWVTHLIQDDTALGKTADDRAALLRRGGLNIYTPLNLDLQGQAQQALSGIVPPTMSNVAIGGANVDVEVGTGRVLSMVQNTAYNDTSQAVPGTTALNYSVDQKDGGAYGFQVGSSYKAFTLLDWLKEGHSINDSVTAANGTTTIPARSFHTSCPSQAPTATWTLENDGPGEGGRMSVISATAASVNTAYAAMATQLDLCGILKTAESFGIHLSWPYQAKTDANGNAVLDANGNVVLENRQLQGNPASILGTNELAPLTMAAAYAGIANGGKFCTPIGIDKIVGPDGKDLPATPSQCTQAVDPNIAAAAATALQRVMTGGTATSANPFTTPILGKTGTTDNNEQNWLVTSTTKVATATWVGNLEGHVNIGHTGLPGGRDVKLRVAKPILTVINDMYGGDKFPTPTGSTVQSKQITIPDLTGKSAGQAQNTLENLGFQYQDGGQIDSTLPAGTVAKTDPAGGSSASVGSTVTVYTSRANLVAVPSGLTGMKLGQAVQSLQAAGLGYQVEGNNPNATVTGVDPAEGTPVPPGTKVSLTVSTPTGKP